MNCCVSAGTGPDWHFAEGEWYDFAERSDDPVALCEIPGAKSQK